MWVQLVEHRGDVMVSSSILASDFFLPFHSFPKGGKKEEEEKDAGVGVGGRGRRKQEGNKSQRTLIL